VPYKKTATQTYLLRRQSRKTLYLDGGRLLVAPTDWRILCTHYFFDSGSSRLSAGKSGPKHERTEAPDSKVSRVEASRGNLVQDLRRGRQSPPWIALGLADDYVTTKLQLQSPKNFVSVTLRRSPLGLLEDGSSDGSPRTLGLGNPSRWGSLCRPNAVAQARTIHMTPCETWPDHRAPPLASRGATRIEHRASIGASCIHTHIHRHRAANPFLFRCSLITG
jgi:hypothetical protein